MKDLYMKEYGASEKKQEIGISQESCCIKVAKFTIQYSIQHLDLTEITS